MPGDCSTALACPIEAFLVCSRVLRYVRQLGEDRPRRRTFGGWQRRLLQINDADRQSENISKMMRIGGVS